MTDEMLDALAASHGIKVITRPTVEPWLVAGTEQHILAAARESTSKAPLRYLDEPLRTQDVDLLDDLVRLRHSGPFTHVGLSVRVLAPLFVWTHVDQHAELKTSKTSARYRTLEPVFYVPPFGRPLKPLPGHTSMRPLFGVMSSQEYTEFASGIIEVYAGEYAAYSEALKMVGKEMARAVLPTGLVTSGVVTGNLLSWMRAISVRVREGNQRETYPQRETEEVFAAVLALIGQHFPNVHLSFEHHGLRTP